LRNRGDEKGRRKIVKNPQKGMEDGGSLTNSNAASLILVWKSEDRSNEGKEEENDKSWEPRT